MARPWNAANFDQVYERFICRDEYHFGGRAFYLRYRSRYEECVRRFAQIAPSDPVDILDVGGGQLALVCAKLWNDRGAVSDLPGPHLTFMAENGVKTIEWNLLKADAPFADRFDFVFFSEVIEHLPVPGHIVLERLRKVLRPGGVVICTTPNLYRLRNLVYMALGHPIFDHFRYPEDESALGHVLEYSRAHLDWQFRKAGFTQLRVEYSQMHHSPTNPVFRVLAWIGYPLHIVPHWRDNLVATAYAPANAASGASQSAA
jgi:SAM-dependent methyltransferase